MENRLTNFATINKRAYQFMNKKALPLAIITRLVYIFLWQCKVTFKTHGFETRSVL